MSYCKTCPKKLYEEDKCMAGYSNIPQTIETALNQAKHKGYWPCSFSPFRQQFLEKIVLKQNEWDKLGNLKKGVK